MKNKHKPYQIALKTALVILLFVFSGCSWEKYSSIPRIELLPRLAIAETDFILPKETFGGNHRGLPIVWTVINQGTTGAVVIDNALTTTAPGEVVVRATVAREANVKDYY